jgi:ribonuclease HI
MMARSTHYIGKASNNVAEYTAFLHGLKLAKDLYVSDLRVELDSELIVKQIQGMYAVKKDDLIPLHATALLRMKGWFHTCTVSHIPRAQNKVADALSDRAIDDFLRHQNTGVTEIC